MKHETVKSRKAKFLHKKLLPESKASKINSKIRKGDNDGMRKSFDTHEIILLMVSEKKSKKKQNKVYFIEIRMSRNVFIYKNYLAITLPSKEAFATKSEPYL